MIDRPKVGVEVTDIRSGIHGRVLSLTIEKPDYVWVMLEDRQGASVYRRWPVAEIELTPPRITEETTGTTGD